MYFFHLTKYILTCKNVHFPFLKCTLKMYFVNFINKKVHFKI